MSQPLPVWLPKDAVRAEAAAKVCEYLAHWQVSAVKPKWPLSAQWAGQYQLGLGRVEDVAVSPGVVFTLE